MAANNYSSPADALFQSVEQSYNKTASEVDNLLRTMGSSRMARALSSSRAKGFDEYGNPTNKTAAAYLQQQGQGAFQQSILQDKNFQANQAVWSDQNRPIDERIKSFNDWKEAFTLNALPVYKAQMPNVDVDSAFKSFIQPIEKVLQARNQAVAEGAGITSTLGNLIDYAGYGLDSALRGAKSQYLQQFGTKQEIADWAKERQALDVADFQKMTPYQQDQILRQGQGQGFIERSSGPNGSVLNNMAGMIGGMVPAMAVGMGAGATLGTMVSPGVGTVGGALAGGLTFGAQNADAYVQSILNSNMSQPEKEAALGDNAMLLATGTGVLAGAAAPYAGRAANKLIMTPIATKLAQRAVAKATAKGGAKAGAEAAAKAVAKATNPSYARNVVSNAVENAGIMTANNMGVNASVNAGTGKPLTQDIMNGTGESIATAIALAPIFGAMHSWRRRPANKPTDKTDQPTPTEPTPTEPTPSNPIVDETTGVESTHPVESNTQSPEVVLQKTASDRAFQAVSNGTLTDTQWRLLQGLIDNDTFDFNNIDAAIQYVKENCPVNGVDLANAQQESQSWFHNFMIGLRSATDRPDSAEVYNQWAKEHPEEATVPPFDQAQKTQETLKNDPAYAAQMAAMQDTSSLDNTQNNMQTPEQPQKRKWQQAKEKRQAKNKEPEQQASTEQTGTETQGQQASTEQTLSQKLAAYDKISPDKRIALLSAAKSKNFTEEDIINAAELLQDTPKGSVQKTLTLVRRQRLDAEQVAREQQGGQGPIVDNADQQEIRRQLAIQSLREKLPVVFEESDPRSKEVYDRLDNYTYIQLYDTDGGFTAISNMLQLLHDNPEMSVAEAERQSGIATLAIAPHEETFNLWKQKRIATEKEIEQVKQALVKNPIGDPRDLLLEVQHAKTAENASSTGNANPDSGVEVHSEGDTEPNPSVDTTKTPESSGTDESRGNGRTPLSVVRQTETPNGTPKGAGVNPTEIQEQRGGNGREFTPTSKAASEGTGSTTSSTDGSTSDNGNVTDASGGKTVVEGTVNLGWGDIPVQYEKSDTHKEFPIAKDTGINLSLIDNAYAEELGYPPNPLDKELPPELQPIKGILLYTRKENPTLHSITKRLKDPNNFGNYEDVITASGESDGHYRLYADKELTFDISYNKDANTLHVELYEALEDIPKQQNIDDIEISMSENTFKQYLNKLRNWEATREKAKAEADAKAKTEADAKAKAKAEEKLTEVKVGQTPQDRLDEIAGQTNMKTEAKIAYVLFGKSGGKKTEQELPGDTRVSEDGTSFITEDGIVGKFNTDTNEVVCTAPDGSEVVRIPARKPGFDNMLKRIDDRQEKKNDVTVIRNEDTSDVAVFAPSIYNEDPEGFVRGFYNDPNYVESVTFDNTKRGNGCTIKFRGIKDPVKLTYRNGEIYFIHKGKKVVIEKNVDGRGAFDFVTDIGNAINKAAMNNLRDYHSAGRTVSLDASIGGDDGSRTVGEQIADTIQQVDPLEFEEHKKQIKATLKKILPESKLGGLYKALDKARTEDDLHDVEQQAVEALSLKQSAEYAKDLFEDAPDKDITDYINNIENSGFDLGDYDIVHVDRQQTSDGRTDRQNFTFTIRNQDTGEETKAAIKIGMKNGKFVPKQEGVDGKFYSRKEFDEQGIEPKDPLIIGDVSYDNVSKFKQTVDTLFDDDFLSSDAALRETKKYRLTKEEIIVPNVGELLEKSSAFRGSATSIVSKDGVRTLILNFFDRDTPDSNYSIALQILEEAPNKWNIFQITEKSKRPIFDSFFNSRAEAEKELSLANRSPHSWIRALMFEPYDLGVSHDVKVRFNPAIHETLDFETKKPSFSEQLDIVERFRKILHWVSSPIKNNGRMIKFSKDDEEPTILLFRNTTEANEYFKEHDIPARASELAAGEYYSRTLYTNKKGEIKIGGGFVVIYGDYVKSVGDLINTLTHEVFVHATIDRYFPGTLRITALLESYRTWTAKEKKAFKEWLLNTDQSYPDRLKIDTPFDDLNQENKAKLLEEFLANHLASLTSYQYEAQPVLHNAAFTLLKGFLSRVYDFLQRAVAKALGIRLKKDQDLFDTTTAHSFARSLVRLATEGKGWNETTEAKLGMLLLKNPGSKFIKERLGGYIPERAKDASKAIKEDFGFTDKDIDNLINKEYDPVLPGSILQADGILEHEITSDQQITDPILDNLKRFANKQGKGYLIPYKNTAIDHLSYLYDIMKTTDSTKLHVDSPEEFFERIKSRPNEILAGLEHYDQDFRMLDMRGGHSRITREEIATSFDDLIPRNTDTPKQKIGIQFSREVDTFAELGAYDGLLTSSPKLVETSKKPVITRIKKLANGVVETEEIELKGRARDLFDNTQVRDNSLWLDWTTKIANTLKDSHAKINQFFATYFDDPTKSLARNPLVSLLNLVPARIQGARNELLKPLEDIRNSMKETAQRLGMSLEDTLELAGMWATARHSDEANAHQLKLYDEQIARYETLMQEKKIDPHAQNLSPRKQKIVNKWNAVKEKKMHLEMILDRVRDPNDKDYKDVQHIRTGTGLTNAEAKKVMQDILAKGFTEDELNTFSDKLSAYHRDIVQDFAKRNKLVPEDNKLPNFQHYVPATKRLESTYFADNDAVPLLNMGDLYSRSGRDTVADNGWTSTLDAVRRISSQAGYADFSDAFLAAARVQEARFGKDDPRNGFVITKYADKMGNLLTGSGAERYDSMNFIKKGGFVCKDPDTGERLIVRFKQNGWVDPTTGLTGEQLNESLTATPRMDNAFGKAMTTTTGWFGQALTRLKPLFAPASMTRDTFERSFAIAGDSYQLDNGTVINGPKLAMKFLYNMSTGRIGKMFFDALMGRDNPKAKQYYDEYVKLGGKQDLSTMGIIDRPDILNTKDTKPEAVQKMLFKIQQQCPELYKILGEATPDVAAKALNMLDHWNDYFNSMAGFGQYVTMREAGISEKAAVNATLEFMNLNQTGTATPVLRCLYPFVKPTIQGGAAMMRSLGFAYDPRGFWHPARLKSYGYILGAFAAAAVIKGLVEDSFGTDENGNKKIDAMSMDQLSSFIPLPIGDNEYLRLNIGFGLPQVVMTTLYGMDRVQRGLMSPGDVAARIMLTSLKNLSPGNWPSFNPSENPTAYVMQTLTPTFFRPFVEVATNTSYSGNTLVFPSANRGVSKAYSGGARAMEVYHDMAKTIFDYTGLDLAPEQVQNIASNLFVGPFGFIKDLWEKNDPGKTSTNLYKDSHLDPILYTIGASMHIGKMPNNEQQLFYLQDDKYNKLMREKHIDLTKHPNGLTGSDLTDWQRKTLEDTDLSDKDISNILILNAARRAMQGKTKEINTLLRAGIRSKEDNDRLMELFNQLDEFKQSVYVSTLEALE